MAKTSEETPKSAEQPAQPDVREQTLRSDSDDHPGLPEADDGKPRPQAESGQPVGRVDPATGEPLHDVNLREHLERKNRNSTP